MPQVIVFLVEALLWKLLLEPSFCENSNCHFLSKIDQYFGLQLNDGIYQLKFHRFLRIYLRDRFQLFEIKYRPKGRVATVSHEHRWLLLLL